MTKQCTFNRQWLDEQLNPKFAAWISYVPGDTSVAFCKVCSKNFKLSNMGRQAVVSHANGPHHQKNMRAKLSQPSVSSFLSATSSKKTTELPNLDCATEEKPLTLESNKIEVKKTKTDIFHARLVTEDVRKAEIIWALEVVAKKFSLNCCENINNTFQQMFPDSSIASKFTFGRTKAAYVINHGLAPHFKTCLLDDIKECTNYVICFDESLNKISQRSQMDQVIRFWDVNQQRVSTRYLNSVFLGRATANDLLVKFVDCLALPLDRLLQVSMDGPNVNFSFLRKLKDKMQTDDANGRHLIHIGSCGLHVLNGAIKTGLKEAGWNLNQFLRDIYYLFKDSPARRAEFTAITSCKQFPQKFCSIRWLENVDCLTRAMLLYDHVKKYVEESSLPSCKQKVCLKEAFKDSLLKCKLAAYKTIASECESFLRRFQSNKPLLPFLFTHLLEIMNDLMKRCVKPEKLKEASSAVKIISLDISKTDNLLTADKVDVGFNCKKLLNETKCPDSEKLCMKFEFQKFVLGILRKMQEKSPLKFKFVRAVTCLDPEIIMKYPVLGQKRVDIVLEELHSASRITDDTAEKSKKQYALLCSEANAGFKTQFSEFLTTQNDTIGLDEFYNGILGTDIRFTDIWEVTKICLILSHGNASVESGFSINKSLLVENLLESSLVSQRIVHDAITYYGGVNCVKISRKLLQSVNCARKRYQDFLEEQKLRQSEELKNVKEKRRISDELQEFVEKKKKNKSGPGVGRVGTK